MKSAPLRWQRLSRLNKCSPTCAKLDFGLNFEKVASVLPLVRNWEVNLNKQVKKELLWVCGLSALALYASRRKKSSLLPIAAGAWLALQNTEVENFRGHSAFITGGSRGLGLALATRLVKEGAKVTLMARDADELLRARVFLESLNGGPVHTVCGDVTDTDHLRNGLAEALQKFNGLDLLINNAGAITVGPWETMTTEDFEAQMSLHLYAPMNALRLALPYLRENDSGKRVVNICSMGGRVAVPHMLPYDTSKFALSGFSQGVAAELADEGISVTTIYPTLIRTGSPIQAVFKGDHAKEFAWFQAGDVMPGFSSSADSVAQQILQATRERRWELTPSILGRTRMLAAALFPEMMGQMMVIINRAMPKGTSRQHRTGYQSRDFFDRAWWSKLFAPRARRLEQKFNQAPSVDARNNLGLH